MRKFKKYDVIKCRKEYRIILGYFNKNGGKYYAGLHLNYFDIKDIFGRKYNFWEGTKWSQPASIVEEYFKKIK